MPKRPLRAAVREPESDDSSDFSTYDSDPDNPIPRKVRVSAAEFHEAQEAQRQANEPLLPVPSQALAPVRATETPNHQHEDGRELDGILQMGNVVDRPIRKRSNDTTVMLQADIYVLTDLTENSTKRFLSQAQQTNIFDYNSVLIPEILKRIRLRLISKENQSLATGNIYNILAKMSKTLALLTIRL